MSRVIEVAWLGPVTIRVDGQAPPPEVFWRKHLALAVVLWHDRHRMVARDHLLGLLWPDRPEAAARHSLNEALRVMRRAFGDGAITSSSDAVGWTGDMTLDSDEFHARAEEDPTAAARMVRGNWCDGLMVPGSTDFEEWAAARRDQWRGRLVATLVRAATTLADRGEPDALGCAEHALRLHPWSDEAAMAVMQARWLAGDRAGAVAAGRDHARRLAEDLGAVPTPAAVALFTRLQRGAMAPAAITTSSPRVAPPFLCRESTLAAAKAAWRTTNGEGGGCVVACLGASGTGRSRLLQEMAAWLRVTGVAVAELRAVPGDAREATEGLHALADAILRALPGVGGGDPVAVANLAAQRPSWGERFPGVVRDREMPLHDALAAVLRAASEEAPLALLVDDVDRFHPDAVAALVALARALSEHPVSLMVTATTEHDNVGVDAMVRVVGAEVPGVVVMLPPLSFAHIEALVAWALPAWAAAAQARLVRRLAQEAGSSVFIAVEVLDAIRSGLDLPDPSPAWPTPGHTFDTTLPSGTPHALTFALRHAFRQLPPNAQRLLQIIAVQSEPHTERALGAAWPAVSDMSGLLDRLEQTGWLASDHRGYHVGARAVQRFIAQDTLTPGQRRRYQEKRSGVAPPHD